MTGAQSQGVVLQVVKMIKLAFFIAFFGATVYGSGELTILHHPASLEFKGHDPIKESILKEVYSAALGFSTEQYSNWQGFFINDPFNLAESTVTVAVEGVADIGLAKGHHFPLKTDETESEVFESVEERISQRYPESTSQLVRVDLSTGLEQLHSYPIFRSIKSDKPKKSGHSHLKNHIDEDREFLKELTLLNSITNKIEQKAVNSDNVPDIFWFKVSGLHALSDLYGENSTQVKEAKQMLNDAIIRLNAAFNKAYNGRVLVSVITSDAVHTRRGRSILQAKADEPTVNINLAKDYSQDYPVIFNIILWFGVAMVFSLLAICIAIASMDPGRDSIIYRMTSTRMKKDN